MFKVVNLKCLLLFSFTLFFQHLSFANEDLQAWMLLKKELQIKAKINLSIQGQWRFSEDVSSLTEEQVNLRLSKQKTNTSYAFLFTLGTINTYERVREFRYALEVEKRYQLSPLFLYSLRLRQEARDFRILQEWAHRFRLRNHFSLKLSDAYFSNLFFSNEFNVYLNSFSNIDAGFSSHRVIVGLLKKRNDDVKSWSLAYVHDLQIIENPNFTRHVLQASYTF